MHNTIIDDSEIHPLLQQRAKIGNHSGYLDDQYEITTEFPSLPQYHFRIQNQQEIIALQNMMNNSVPNNMHQVFTNSTDAFKNKLDLLLIGLDSHSKQFKNNHQIQSHGYYQLAQSYDDQKMVDKILEDIKQDQLCNKMQSLNINERKKPQFIKRVKAHKMEGQVELKKLNSKFSKITISQSDL